MHVSQLRLHDFRSYGDFHLDDLGKMTIFVGPNAVGKTNIIEALQLVTALDSFRASKTDQLVRWGSECAAVDTTLSDEHRRLEVRLVLNQRGRHYLLNGKTRPRQELQGQLPAVLFTPDDLQLVKGGPELRRAAIDALGVQVSRNYLTVKRDYEKLLRQKNRLLKEEATPAYLASVNEVMARIGSQLICYRLRIVREIQLLFPERHRQTTASEDIVGFEYCPSVLPERREDDIGDNPVTGAIRPGEIESYLSDRNQVERDYIRMLAARAPEEMARHTSVVGPHRDKPVFTLNGHMAHDYASQGQQRSLAIAYKLAELDVIERLVHQKPILLLDDVMSELDSSRRDTLTRYVSHAAQTFITTTNLDYFTPSLRDAADIIVLPR